MADGLGLRGGSKARAMLRRRSRTPTKEVSQGYSEESKLGAAEGRLEDFRDPDCRAVQTKRESLGQDQRDLETEPPSLPRPRKAETPSQVKDGLEEAELAAARSPGSSVHLRFRIPHLAAARNPGKPRPHAGRPKSAPDRDPESRPHAGRRASSLQTLVQSGPRRTRRVYLPKRVC
jgi:hypothetical protein